jgi:hypothetical protein
MILVRYTLWLYLLFSSTPFCVGTDRSLNEEDRINEYNARGYTWPLNEVNPNTDGWRKLVYRRMQQLDSVEDLGERYNGWIQTIGKNVGMDRSS